MRRAKVFAVLPTMLTLGNAACGFGAITFAAKVGPDSAVGNELFIASLLVFLAMIFDMLDGSAARWARQTTDFGAQLDSLCDALSFGAAPAFVMLQFNRTHAASASEYLVYHPRLLWVIAVLYVVCALLRLARFNVETDDDDSHEYFSGLPSPAAAGTVASFPIAMKGLQLLAENVETRAHRLSSWLVPAMTIALPIITLSVACLMVSRLRYSHVFNQLFRGHRPRQHFLQLVFTVAVVFLVPYMALPSIFCYFAFATPIKAFWVELVSRRNARQVDKPAEP